MTGAPIGPQGAVRHICRLAIAGRVIVRIEVSGPRGRAKFFVWGLCVWAADGSMDSRPKRGDGFSSPVLQTPLWTYSGLHRVVLQHWSSHIYWDVVIFCRGGN